MASKLCNVFLLFVIMRNVLVYGGNGALGRAVVSLLKQNNRVVCIDFPGSKPSSDSFIPLDPTQSPQEHVRFILHNVQGKVDAVIHTAGGWNGGTISSDDFPESFEKMWRMNSMSAVNAAHIAAKLLQPFGTLILTGALVAENPCASMLSYSVKSLNNCICLILPRCLNQVFTI
jgi:dihydropteridine reductase